MPKVPNTDQLVEWIDRIMRDAINTTTWEDEFMIDMQTKVEQWGDKVNFSQAQAEIIERIYSQRVP